MFTIKIDRQIFLLIPTGPGLTSSTTSCLRLQNGTVEPGKEEADCFVSWPAVGVVCVALTLCEFYS